MKDKLKIRYVDKTYFELNKHDTGKTYILNAFLTENIQNITLMLKNIVPDGTYYDFIFPIGTIIQFDDNLISSFIINSNILIDDYYGLSITCVNNVITCFVGMVSGEFLNYNVKFSIIFYNNKWNIVE